MNGSYLAFPREGGLNQGGQTPESSQHSDSYSLNHPQHSFYRDQQQTSLYTYNPSLTFAGGNSNDHSLFMPITSTGHLGTTDPLTLSTLTQLQNYSSLHHQHNNFKDYYQTPSTHLASFANSPLDNYYNNLQQQHHHRRQNSASLYSLAPQDSDISDLDPLLLMTGLFNSSPHDNSASNNREPTLTSSLAPSDDLCSSKTQQQQQQQQIQVTEPWLDELQITCSALSLEPLRGSEVLQRVQLCMNDVLTRYIPCVDFLVECQQSLRKGLAMATRKSGGKRYYQEAMTPTQFLAAFVEPLPGQFYAKTEHTMDRGALEDALRELNTLVGDARSCTRQGSEAVKNSFLGGMKDGESWGLRKWLSRHGNALRVCTELECLLGACKQLERSMETTQKLARLLRPLAQRTLTRLKSDVPQSYQEVSAAHPYLPFFHRLEAALRSMSQFDPEEDAVICIDDSDDDDDNEIEEVFKEPPTRGRKRKQEIDVEESSVKAPESKEAKLTVPRDDHQSSNKQAEKQENDDSSSGESEEDSVVEIIDVKPASQPTPVRRHVPVSRSPSEATSNWPIPIDEEYAQSTSERMASSLNNLAAAIENDTEALNLPRVFDPESFWSYSRFAAALRLFALILRQPEALHFVNSVDEDVLVDSGHKRFSHVVKHPLCFRDIFASIIQDSGKMGSDVPQTNNGVVASPSQWNMWKGSELLQAIDLVLLNALAYGQALGEGKSTHRSKINKLRKMLWNGIQSIMQEEKDIATRRRFTPTRRSEDSGFVVYKIKER